LGRVLSASTNGAQIESVKGLLTEAQAILDIAERENRALKRSEKEHAETLLKEIRERQDGERVHKAIEGTVVQGPLCGGSASSSAPQQPAPSRRT
jgi:hypothetical protein